MDCHRGFSTLAWAIEGNDKVSLRERFREQLVFCARHVEAGIREYCTTRNRQSFRRRGHLGGWLYLIRDVMNSRAIYCIYQLVDLALKVLASCIKAFQARQD